MSSLITKKNIQNMNISFLIKSSMSKSKPKINWLRTFYVKKAKKTVAIELQSVLIIWNDQIWPYLSLATAINSWKLISMIFSSFVFACLKNGYKKQNTIQNKSRWKTWL